MVNGYGTPTTGTLCQEWVDVPNGKFADPDLYAAKNSLEGQATKELYRTTFLGLATANPGGSGKNSVAAIASMRSDAEQLIGNNACASSALMRFQENLTRFATGKQGILLSGAQACSASAAGTSSAANFKDSDNKRFLADLIADQATTWMANRYQKDSVSEVKVVSRDKAGRPLSIAGQYAFIDFNGHLNQGSVFLKFTDGVPGCLAFWDAPDECRAPNRKMVAAYMQGGYL